MTNEPKWKPEPNDDVDKLREIKRLMGGWWAAMPSRGYLWNSSQPEQDHEYWFYRSEILASARAFGWEYGLWQVYRDSGILFDDGVVCSKWMLSWWEGGWCGTFDNELDAHLEMTRRAAAERDKRKKPSRKADAVKILNALTIQPEDVLAALDRLATGDYE